MSYVKDQDILDATNGGLDIIRSYYPSVDDVIISKKKHFKLRESEKTASAGIKQIENVWIVKDFGGDNVSRNGIQVCMLEEGKTYGEACNILGSRYNIQGAVLQAVKPIIEKRALKEEETPGSYHFSYKDFTKEELALLGPRVNETNCGDFKLRSCESFAYCKENETIVTTATADFPIFVFDFGEWQKIYQPNSFEKKYRFRYAGTKPKRHVFGMDLIKKEFEIQKKKYEEEYDEDDEEDEKKKKRDFKLDAVFIVSGGSDGINLRSFGKFPIWFNSESEHLEYEELKSLRVWAKEIYYIADLDSTGVKQAVSMGLKFLDIRLLWLPERLKNFSDKRGYPCKDYKDYVDKFYNAKQPNLFIQSFDKLVNNALPFQFWTEQWTGKKLSYNLSNTRLYHFLSFMGFGRYEDKNSKDGFIYIKKEGSIVKILHPYEIENYVHSFLEERQMHPDLRDYVYKSNQLGERSISKLPKVNIDFTNADRNTQFLFFSRKVWKITGTEIVEYHQGQTDNFVWEDKVIDFNIQKDKESQFKITKDAEGDFNIQVLKKDNPFFNYLINASRVHWKKELEEHFEDKKEVEAEEYYLQNKFNIAGEHLSADEIYEQKVHLVNKIYSIGYLLHTYKDDSKPWCLFVMDNKISETGESHGGSGKSVGFGNMNHILKRRFYIKGRDPKVTQNDFIYHGVTEDTDYIFIDDANQYLDFGFFYSEITGSLKVNPKNGQPFEIPFAVSPKFVITSNFTIKDDGPSTARRLLFCSFSDYYHENKDGEYKQARNIADDFGGRNLFRDFTEQEWNSFYNFCAQCIQFYLSHPAKINPPMDNVTKRSLRAEMGDAFEGWAEAFFSIKDADPVTFIESEKYLDNYFSKADAYDDFIKVTKLGKWTPNKFKKALKAFCQLNGYIFCPKEYHTAPGRIVQKINGKAEEVIYIAQPKTNEKPVNIISGVKEYKNEDEIFNQ